MRLVHLMTHLRLGAGRAIVDLCLEQRRCGHDVAVMLSTDAEASWRSDPALVDELRAEGVAIDVIGDVFHRDWRSLDDASVALRTRVGRWEGVVAHAHTAMTGAVACWAGASRIVTTCHGWSLERPAGQDLQDALAFSMVDRVISPSSAWAARVRALPGAPPVVVVPNGFDLRRYPRMSRRTPDARRPARIVCVGELTARKGQDLLLEAMPLLWQGHPDTTLDIIGDGDMAAELHGLARRIDPTHERIRFRGHMATPYRLLADAEVFCLPSRSDNQPVAIVEAMLAGLPIVATDVGGVREMVDGPDVGVIVPAESAEALAEGLVRMLTRSDRDTLAERAGAFARREYDVAVVAGRIEAIYRSIGIDERKAGRATGDAGPVRRS